MFDQRFCVLTTHENDTSAACQKPGSFVFARWTGWTRAAGVSRAAGGPRSPSLSLAYSLCPFWRQSLPSSSCRAYHILFYTCHHLFQPDISTHIDDDFLSSTSLVYLYKRLPWHNHLSIGIFDKCISDATTHVSCCISSHWIPSWVIISSEHHLWSSPWHARVKCLPYAFFMEKLFPYLLHQAIDSSVCHFLYTHLYFWVLNFKIYEYMFIIKIYSLVIY